MTAASVRQGGTQSDDKRRYPAALRGLHWLVVLLLIGQFAVAWTMPEVHKGTAPTGLIAWHLSLGIVIWLVMAVRLAVRLSSPVPPPPDDLPAGLRLLSRSTHYAFYLLLLLLPVLGFMNASARGWNVRLFGLIPMPALVPTGSPTGRAMGDVHQTVALILLGVIALHVAGALYHALILKDRVVHRILPS